MRSVLLGAAALVLVVTSVARADLTITNGGLWSLDTRVKVSACVAGQCDRDQVSQTDEVSLSEGTTVQVRIYVFSCDIAVLDYCDVVPRRNGKLKIVKCDKGQIGDLLRNCSPYDGARVRRVSGFERVGPDGNSFKWKAVLAFSFRQQGFTVSVNVVATVDGTLVAPALSSGEPVPATLEPPDATALIESLVGEILGR